MTNVYKQFDLRNELQLRNLPNKSLKYLETIKS